MAHRSFGGDRPLCARAPCTLNRCTGIADRVTALTTIGHRPKALEQRPHGHGQHRRVFAAVTAVGQGTAAVRRTRTPGAGLRRRGNRISLVRDHATGPRTPVASLRRTEVPLARLRDILALDPAS